MKKAEKGCDRRGCKKPFIRKTPQHKYHVDCGEVMSKKCATAIWKSRQSDHARKIPSERVLSPKSIRLYYSYIPSRVPLEYGVESMRRSAKHVSNFDR